jgi:hypothetical protein
MRRTKKTKRLILRRSPLQLTDLGLEVLGELEMSITDMMKPYVRSKLPNDSLGLILKDAVRAWRRKG